MRSQRDGGGFCNGALHAKGGKLRIVRREPADKLHAVDDRRFRFVERIALGDNLRVHRRRIRDERIGDQRSGRVHNAAVERQRAHQQSAFKSAKKILAQRLLRRRVLCFVRRFVCCFVRRRVLCLVRCFARRFICCVRCAELCVKNEVAFHRRREVIRPVGRRRPVQEDRTIRQRGRIGTGFSDRVARGNRLRQARVCNTVHDKGNRVGRGYRRGGRRRGRCRRGRCRRGGLRCWSCRLGGFRRGGLRRRWVRSVLLDCGVRRRGVCRRRVRGRTLRSRRFRGRCVCFFRRGNIFCHGVHGQKGSHHQNAKNQA